METTRHVASDTEIPQARARPIASYGDTPLGFGGSSWLWMLLFGVATIVLGLLALVWPAKTIVVVAFLFGIQLLVTGLFRTVLSLTTPGQQRAWHLLVGILSIVAGVLCLRDLFQTVGILVLILGIYWIVHGVADFFGGLANRDLPNRWVTVATGALGVAAGVLVLAYPAISLLTLTWIMGAWLIVLGMMEALGAMQLRTGTGMGGRPLGYAA